MSDKGKPFITADEAVTQLRNLIENDTEGVITTDALNLILERVATGKTITERGVKTGILEALERAGEQGINTSYLFAYMRRGGDYIPMAILETYLLELEREGKIWADRNGGLTVYRRGQAPANG